MKSCSKIHPWLSLEAEGALSSRDQKKVQTHLRDCADARKELASYKRLRRTLRALPEPKEPGNLHEKIMTRLHQKKSGKSENLFHFRPLWPAAVAAATAVFFFIQYPNWQDRLTSQSKTASVKTNLPVAKKVTSDKKSETNLQSPPKAAAFAPVPQADVREMVATRSNDESADASLNSNLLAGGAPQGAAASSGLVSKTERKRMALKTQPAAPAMAMAQTNSLDAMQQGASAAPAAQRDLESAAVSLWSGDQDTHTPIAQQTLITDEASFETVWNNLEPGKPVPTVDFSAQAVVFLEAGLEPNAGYKVQVLQMEDKPNHLVIHWEDMKPSPDALTSQVVTYPWVLQVIDKPSKPVSFTEDE